MLFQHPRWKANGKTLLVTESYKFQYWSGLCPAFKPFLEAKKHPTRSALKSLNAQLAVHYPAYTIIICQVKAVINVNSVIFGQMGENDIYFCQIISSVDEADWNYPCKTKR